MLTLSLGLFMACQSEIDTKPAAEVKDVTADVKKSAKPSPLANKKLVKMPPPGAKIEPVQPVVNGMRLSEGSTLEFIGAKVTSDHKGGFKTVKGGATLGEDGSIASVNLKIDMTSLYADEFPGSTKFVSHLKAEDFFFVQQHPIASFKSTKIEGNTITGIFDMRGVQKEISFDATFVNTEPYGLKAEFKINRKLWGIEYAGKADNLIKDDVAIIADLQFAK